LNDPDRNAWAEVISRIRQYAKEHARRHWVLLDAHVLKGGMLKGDQSLRDFNSLPLSFVPGCCWDAVGLLFSF
jgi:hypothetical protein